VFGWDKGDFNYDGKINIDDYGIIDGNINRQGAPFSTAELPASPGMTVVPEPAGAVLALAAAGVALRRRVRPPRAAALRFSAVISKLREPRLS
jgi:hypothetical protein